MGKIVNVIINSNNALNTNAADVSNNFLEYSIDWSAILESNCAYRMHWSYTGQPNTLTSASKIAQVQIDFQMQQYLNQSSVYGAPTTFTIGCLRSFYLNGTTNYLFADDNNNPVIYLENRPYSNRFRVSVLNNDSPPTRWFDNAASPLANGSYILSLSFEKVETT